MWAFAGSPLTSLSSRIRPCVQDRRSSSDMHVCMSLGFAEIAWLSATVIFPLVFLRSLVNFPVTFQVSPRFGSFCQGSWGFLSKSLKTLPSVSYRAVPPEPRSQPERTVRRACSFFPGSYCRPGSVLPRRLVKQVPSPVGSSSGPSMAVSRHPRQRHGVGAPPSSPPWASAQD